MSYQRAPVVERKANRPSKKLYLYYVAFFPKHPEVKPLIAKVEIRKVFNDFVYFPNEPSAPVVSRFGEWFATIEDAQARYVEHVQKRMDYLLQLSNAMTEAFSEKPEVQKATTIASLRQHMRDLTVTPSAFGAGE